MSRAARTYTCDWPALRDVISQVLVAPSTLNAGKRTVSSKLAQIHARCAAGEEWSTGGADTDTLGEWLDGGYTFPVLADDQVPALPVDGIRAGWLFDMDGDLRIDRMHGGECELFARRARRKCRTGLDVQVLLSVPACTDHATVARFGAWAGMFCESLQSCGYDLGLSVGVENGGLWTNARGVTANLVQVSRLGERFFARDWAFLFSPAGYRVGMFVAKCLPDLIPDQLRGDSPDGLGQLAAGLGRPVVRDGIEWDPADRVLRIEWGGGEFDPLEYQQRLDGLTID